MYCVTCWEDPAPLYEDLPQVVGVPDLAPPAGHDQLLVAGGGHGVQVGQPWAGRVLGKLAPGRLAASEDHVSDDVHDADEDEVVPGDDGVPVEEVPGDQGG